MRISVVTPSYGQLEYLKLCAASVADQTGAEVEHIVQDAGTEGISEAQLRPLTMREYELALYVEKDGGMYDAINRGLRRSTGEICAYLNCDEQYLPGSLARVARFFIARPDVDVLFGDFILAERDGRPLSYRRVVRPSLHHLRSAPLSTGSCATFFRRSLLDRGLYFDTQWKASGDAVWMEALLESGARMATLPEPLAVFVFTGENLGASELSRAEGDARKGKVGVIGNLARKAAILWHRARKASAGAYRRRRVEIEIYTRGSPERRQRIAAENVGFGWPA